MKMLYFDCFSGISGDMTLGALLDLGINKDNFLNELSKLNLKGYDIKITKEVKNGITGTSVNIIADANIEQPHRHLSDILHIISTSTLTSKVKTLSSAIFTRLGRAEAKVHGVSIDEIHFHEVGAVDSIIDIVGTCICIDFLKIDMAFASRINDGCGFAVCMHGKIPVPVPAVLEILSEVNAPIVLTTIEGEMVTPTGAAIIAEICGSFAEKCNFKISRVGYGFGKKDFGIPNALRVMLGETETLSDNITVIETNLDDISGELLGYTMDRLFEAGALDVFFTPIYMKKQRPAYKLTVLCSIEVLADIEKTIFIETTAIGIRKYTADRVCLDRTQKTIDTMYGLLKVKQAEYGSATKQKVEFEDAKAKAIELAVPLINIVKSV